MKKSVVYLYFFIFFMAIILIFFISVLYPNLRGDNWRICISIFASCTGLSFILSWVVSPGYITKKAEGEFLLLLTRFDPNTLCPFCEIVQIPLSKHCFACNKCV